MCNRLAAVALAGALIFTGCGKKSEVAKPKDGATPAATAAGVTESGAPATPVPAATPAKPAIDQNAQVVVYGYHRFEKKIRRPDTEITPEAFEEQMKMLKEKNIPVIPMQDFLAWKRGEKNIPSRAVVLTFDDGWKTQYEVAWPILKKYGFPFTLFIYTEGVRPGHFAGGGSMSWENLEEMRDAGVDIQGHSATHQDLRKAYDAIAKKKLTPEEYEEWLANETAGVKKVLEDKLGIRVNAFAVPYGKHDENVRKAVMKGGYEAMFTVYGQPLTFGSPMDSLGRYLIEANKPKVFEDALNFGGASTGSGPAVAQVDAKAIQAQPGAGTTAPNETPLIKANLAPFGEIEAESVVMRIGGVGKVPAVYDAKTKTITYQMQRKQADRNVAVIIEARSGTRKMQASWSFDLPGGKTAPAPAPAASPQG